MGSRGCNQTTADTCVENPMAGAGTEGVGVSEEAACSLAPRYTQGTPTVLTHNAEKPITLHPPPSPHPLSLPSTPSGVHLGLPAHSEHTQSERTTST